MGAGRFVLGRVVGLPGRVSLSARLHDTFGEGPDPELVTVEGPVDSLSALVDDLATGLLESSLSGANARIQLSAAQSAGSLEATKEFLRGEQFHRRGQFDSASAAYNRALALDSTFALAHLMKSMNNAYTYETDDYAAAESAMRFAGGLPERDRSLIAAFLDLQAGRLTSAEQGFVAHLKRWPDEVKGLLMLGILYHRSNVRWARPIQQSRPYFERVLELEPENVPALHNLARLDAAAGFADSLPARTRVLDRVAPESEWAVDAGTLSAFARGDRAAIDRLVETFPAQSLLVRLYAVYNALRFSPDPGDADRLLAAQSSGPVNPETGIPERYTLDEDLTLWIQGLVDLAAGRHDAVRAFLARPSPSEAWDIWKAELAVADVVSVDAALAAELLERVQAIDPYARLRNPLETLHDIFTPAVAELERDVNVARLLGRLGRFEEAWAIQRRLAELPPFEAFESLHRDAAGGVAADLLALQGDSVRALEILRSLPFQVPLTARALSVTHGSHARFLRAELEWAIGDPEAARQLYEGFVGAFGPADKIFLTQAYERLGELHEAAGRVDEARFHYEKLVATWSDPSPELIPRREVVRERLEALRARAAA